MMHRPDSMITRGWRAPLMAGLLALVVAGCASAPEATRSERDPFESLNRAVFGFNEGLDTVIVRPVAKAYETVVPQFARTGVANFFGNVADVWTSVNNFLQGKPMDGLSDLGRVVVNSTVGLAGLLDVASEIGLEKHEEDFGQTLGRWGVEAGPYLVLPVFGPRTIRDTMGLGFDLVSDPVVALDNVPTRNSLAALRFTEDRAMLLPIDKTIEEAALDKYAYIRDGYLQRRRNLIFDGRPPREPDEGASLQTAPVAGLPLDPASAVSRLVLSDVKDSSEAGAKAAPAPVAAPGVVAETKPDL